MNNISNAIKMVQNDLQQDSESLQSWYLSIDRWNYEMNREDVLEALREDHETWGEEDVMSLFSPGVELKQIDCELFEVRGFHVEDPDNKMITATVAVFEDSDGELHINSVALSITNRVEGKIYGSCMPVS